ncbi:MAG: hypothetical protein ACFCUN_03630 [Hyphomicrobiaceae bacterium]
MIAHVAEATEAKGRVIVRLTGDREAGAVRAAFEIAEAYAAAVELLVVDDENIERALRFPFVRTLSFHGRETFRVSPRFHAVGHHKLVSDAERLARRLSEERNVAFKASVSTDDPRRAISVACAAEGPWNLVVLPAADHRRSLAEARAILDEDLGATAVALIPPSGNQDRLYARNPASLAVLLEDVGSISALLQAADRFAVQAAALHGRARIAMFCVGPQGRPGAGEIEAAARLVLADRPHSSLLIEARFAGAVPAGADLTPYLDRLAPGLVLARCNLDGPTPETLALLLRRLRPLLILAR